MVPAPKAGAEPSCGPPHREKLHFGARIESGAGVSLVLNFDEVFFLNSKL